MTISDCLRDMSVTEALNYQRTHFRENTARSYLLKTFSSGVLLAGEEFGDTVFKDARSHLASVVTVELRQGCSLTARNGKQRRYLI